jgi:hypothetical protein
MVKPLKMLLPEYQRIEERVEAAIGSRFGVDFQEHADVVRKIDCEMLIAERRQLFNADDVIWYGQENVRQLNLVPFGFFGPANIRLIFLEHAQDLGLA